MFKIKSEFSDFKDYPFKQINDFEDVNKIVRCIIDMRDEQAANRLTKKLFLSFTGITIL